ncbi:MAG: hypothetical protein Q9187_000019 [Circinaria calcarea]
MSTYVRQTSSLAVPVTQNTAPILEFRCLYTHDLRQKKKRWQDGFLRFHTFNKRVMVYDVPRNFIGDTHWREGELVQDGDEMQLEKGVMIQVGEAVGRMDQDLTALLERRNSARDGFTPLASSPPTTYASTARTTGVPLTQLRPKSLNALLGTPKGAYGRATLPSKSPYQQRQPGGRYCQEGSPPAKKQKLEGPVGRRRGMPGEIHNDRNRGVSSGILTTPLSPAPPLRKHVNAESICIGSEDESTRSSSCQRATEKSCSSLNPGASCLNLSSLPLASQSTSNGIQQGSLRTYTIAKAKHTSGLGCRPSPTTIVPQNLPKQKPANPLRFAFTKPRKKLMYRELLPQQTPFRPSPESDDTPTSFGYQLMAKAARDRPEIRAADELTNVNQVQQEAVEAQSSFHQKLESSYNIEPPPPPFNTTSLDSPSTLDTDLQGAEQRDVFAGKEAATGVRVGTEEAVSAAIVPLRSVSPSTIRGYGFAKSPAFIQPAVEKNEDEADSKLSQMDQLLLSQHKPANTQTKRVALPLASERELVVTTECETGACKQPTCVSHTKKPQVTGNIVITSLHPQRTLFDPEVLQVPTISPGLPASVKNCEVPSWRRSHLKKSFSETDKTLNTVPSVKPPVRAHLQKSVSDMTCVPRQFLKGRSHNSPVQNKDLDIGPWSREAFDLFGWSPGEKWEGKEPSLDRVR